MNNDLVAQYVGNAATLVIMACNYPIDELNGDAAQYQFKRVQDTASTAIKLVVCNNTKPYLPIDTLPYIRKDIQS